jgi:hypothetical protein
METGQGAGLFFARDGVGVAEERRGGRLSISQSVGARDGRARIPARCVLTPE